MTTGLQRDGLKAEEVYGIVRRMKKMLEDGESEEVAFSLACRGTEDRPLVGIAAEAFKRWKPGVLDLVYGRSGPADSLGSGAVDPATSKATQNPELMKRLAALGHTNDALSADHKRLLEENAALKTAVNKLDTSEIDKLRAENEKLKQAMLK